MEELQDRLKTAAREKALLEENAKEEQVRFEEEKRRIFAEWEVRLTQRLEAGRKELEGKIYLLIKENDELIAQLEERKRDYDSLKSHYEHQIVIAKVTFSPFFLIFIVFSQNQSNFFCRNQLKKSFNKN